MDPRCNIFHLWRLPGYENLRRRIKASLPKLYDFYILEGLMYDISDTYFDCKKCGNYYFVNKLDITWIIALDPTTYLMEDEYILCMNCCDKLEGENYLIRRLCTKPKKGQKVMDIAEDKHFMIRCRHIYNPKYDVYTLVDFYSNVNDFLKDFERLNVIYRTLNPLHYPFFKIENTLFTILYFTLQDYLA